MNKFRQFWSNLRSSFWFTPSMIVVASIAPQPILFLDAPRDESADSLLQAVTTIALGQANSNHRN